MKTFVEQWQRPEAFYNHWTGGRPKNQVQLAFRRHWELFEEILDGKKGKCLEIGCGRGTMSNYFAENGYDCTLLDSSRFILSVAKKELLGCKAEFVCGDATKMGFADDQFDVVVSIGLMEHFSLAEVFSSVCEQRRVVKKGGWILCYIVPGGSRVQKKFNWVNFVLKIFCGKGNKMEIYRNDRVRKYWDKDYLYGVYPLPMISHSPEFPFSLLLAPLERILVEIFNFVLWVRKLVYRRNPWVCRLDFGQAFLVAFKKE